MRLIVAAVIAAVGYVIPAGAAGVVKNWANILGKESAEKIRALEDRVSALEAAKGAA